MTWCQAHDRSWLATARPSHRTANTVQAGDDLDAAADYRRVHGIVVGVQPDIVVAGQSRRGPPEISFTQPPRRMIPGNGVADPPADST